MPAPLEVSTCPVVPAAKVVGYVPAPEPYRMVPAAVYALEPIRLSVVPPALGIENTVLPAKVWVNVMLPDPFHVKLRKVVPPPILTPTNAFVMSRLTELFLAILSYFVNPLYTMMMFPCVDLDIQVVFATMQMRSTASPVALEAIDPPTPTVLAALPTTILCPAA
jgi:hypothetical protein